MSKPAGKGPFDGEGYVRMSLMGLERRARSDDYPPWVRVEFAAAWRANKWGHAEFKKGELAHLLGRLNQGQWKPLPGPRVSEAIRRAKDCGAIGKSSNVRCLVVVGHEVDQGDHARAKACHEHAAVLLS